ncbi:unnamed protein product [Diplocarpon coronariae]
MILPTGVLSQVLAGLLVARDDTPAGYTLGVMGVSGSYEGHDFNFNGTIQQVEDQLKHLWPGVSVSGAASGGSEINESSTVALDNAGPRDGLAAQFCCPVAGQKWSSAERPVVQNGIIFLNAVKASCSAGPKNCVRVSCSWDAGIFLCNDRDTELISPCTWIAHLADEVKNNCFTCGKTDATCYYAKVCGQ